MPTAASCSPSGPTTRRSRTGARGWSREPDAGVAALQEGLARAAALGLPAFVVGPPPANDEAQADRIVALSARFAAACAGAGTPYVDVAADLRRGGPWLAEARAGDGAHPGAGGYGQLADRVRAPFLRWLRSATL